MVIIEMIYMAWMRHLFEDISNYMLDCDAEQSRQALKMQKK